MPKKIFSCGYREDFKFCDYTTYGVGGKVKRAYFPKNLIQAKYAYNQASCGKFAVVGNGSDILASDKFFDGTVICTRFLKGIINCGDNKILCLSGTTVGELLSYCKRKNFGGLEYLAGIPATVGGLACMNGGACGKYIGENILSVCLYNGDKKIILSNEQCNFAYKHSTMRDINSLIMSVLLKIHPSPQEEIENKILKTLQKRKALPKGRSCGCVFKNVNGVSAGKIIENVGLKGERRGGAFVSSTHANFIINSGGKAKDVSELIRFVKERVFITLGIELEEEVIYIGDFNETDG